jgi:hypothetical protein
MEMFTGTSGPIGEAQIIRTSVVSLAEHGFSYG